MTCDRFGCRRRQRQLHQQASTPTVYYCCHCNSCPPAQQLKHQRRR